MQRIFNEYIEHLTLQNKSIHNAKFSLKLLFNYIAEIELDFIRLKIQQAQDFQTYLVTKTNKKGKIYYSKRSVGTIVGSITAFYDYLAKRKIVYANPFLEVKKLRNPKILPKNILNEEKTNMLLKTLKEFQKGKNLIDRKALYKAHVVCELMYSTGARINEIAKLKLDDVDFIRGVVRITDSKSGQTRDAVLNEYSEKVLRIFVEEMRGGINFNKNHADANLLFGAKTNLKTWLNAILNKRSKKLKFGKFSSHYIRHSVGAHLLKNGCDIRFIQEILGA